MSCKFFGSLSSFLPLSQTLLQTSNTFCNFSSQISLLFPLRLVQLLQLCREEWVKSVKSNFFVFVLLFFLIQCFDSMFWSLGYSIKVLFKDHFTENHGTFETKSYQQKRPRKGNTKKCVAQKYGVIVNMGEKQGKVVVFAGEKGVRTLNDRNCVLEVSISQI